MSLGSAATCFENLVKQARLLHLSGNNQAALKLCEKISSAAPKNWEILGLQASIYLQLKDYTNAIAFADAVTKLKDDISEPYMTIAQSYLATKQYKLAEIPCKKAIALEPHNASFLGKLGEIYLGMNAAAAIECFSLALAQPCSNTAESVINRAAWNVNLGHLYHRARRFADARVCFERAIQCAPGYAIAWGNLACVYRDTGDWPMAKELYSKALALDPTFFDAHFNLGNLFKDSGQYLEALRMYSHALKLKPQDAFTNANMGATYSELGQHALAIQFFELALYFQPVFPDCLNNYANVLRAVERTDEAIVLYQRALKQDPKHADALNNIGNAFKDTFRLAEAETSYRAALASRPNFAGAHINLGNLLKEKRCFKEALKHFTAAVHIDPNFAAAYSNMGNVLKDMGRLDDAIKSYMRAIEIKPDYADAYANMASVYKDTNQPLKAIENYRYSIKLNTVTEPIAFCNLVHCLQCVCDWENRPEIFAKLGEVLKKQMDSGQLPAVQPHHALAYPIAAEQQLRLAKEYAAVAANKILNFVKKTLHTDASSLETISSAIQAVKEQKRRFKLGYLSSDIGDHPLSHLMQNVFGGHDRKRFEVFVYHTAQGDGSEWFQKISSEVEHFVDVSDMNLQETATRVHADKPDILINLNGYTKGSRNEVFALRPAPIQIMYMGFPGSSGASYMHYLVTDEVVSPPRLGHLYTEKLAYMPNSYFVNDHKQCFANINKHIKTDTEINEIRAKYGLPPRPTVVLCCFNQLYKIEPITFQMWIGILLRVPDSVLWLLRFPKEGERNIRAQAEKLGLPKDRLLFTNVAPKAEHVARSVAADIFLDTPLCNAHTTGTDVLWSGTPIVTMPLENMASRVAASLLAASDCQELVSSNIEDYQRKVMNLATDLPRLRALQKRLHAKRSTSRLFDTKMWISDFEDLLSAVIKDFVAGGLTKAHDVPVRVTPTDQPPQCKRVRLCE